MRDWGRWSWLEVMAVTWATQDDAASFQQRTGIYKIDKYMRTMFNCKEEILTHLVILI